jgi:hypothetical protein
MIIESTFTEGPTQVDGRRYVRERHVDDRGVIYEHEWLGDMDASMVMTSRVAVLNSLIADQRAAEALVSGTLLPLTKLKFRELFTQVERTSIDAFRNSLETNPLLTAQQKADIRTGFIDFDNAQNIVRPFLPQVVAMLDLFVSLGLLSSQRRAEIIEAGNG